MSKQNILPNKSQEKHALGIKVNRWILLFQFIFLSVILFSSAAIATSTTTYTSGYYQFRLDSEGNAIITDYSGDEQSVSIPATLDGHLVVSIEFHGFASCISIESLTLPDSLMSIGDAAFNGCSFKSITLPDNIQSIGKDAFSANSSLEYVKLPQNLQSIGESAFYNCSSLKSITLPENIQSIAEDAFNGCDSLESIWISEDNPVYATIDGILFKKDTKLLMVYPAEKKDTMYSVPQGILSVCDMAFYGCDALSSVSLPEGLQSIGSFAFANCPSLVSIIIPNGVQSIGERAFNNDDSLSTATLPESVQFIGDRAFNGCDMLLLMAPENSYAINWAKENQVRYQSTDASNDWLNP